MERDGGGTSSPIRKVVVASFTDETFRKDIYADEPEERGLVAEQRR